MYLVLMLGSERLERVWIDYLGMRTATERTEHQRKLCDQLIHKYRHRIAGSTEPLACYVEGVPSKFNKRSQDDPIDLPSQLKASA